MTSRNENSNSCTNIRLFNISSRAKSLSKKDTDFFAYIETSDETRAQLFIYGCQTEKFIFREDISNIRTFIVDIPKIFDSKIKAIILNVFAYTNKKYENNLVLCEAFKAKLDVCKIPYYFISDLNLTLINAIMTANIEFKIGELLLIVYCGSALKLQFTKNGYRLLEMIFHEEDMAKIDFVQKVLVIDDKNRQKFMKIFKSKNPILIDNDHDYPEKLTKSLSETKKWILDKSLTKFHVIPSSRKYFHIAYKFGEKVCYILDVKHNTDLPFETSKMFENSYFDYFMGYMEYGTGEFVKLKMLEFNREAHKFKITLKIDVNNFPSFEIENVILDRIINFPSFFDFYKLVDIDVKSYPVIAMLGNLSFICIQKNGKCEFLESWGGQWGKPMRISFDNKKPQFGKDAEEMLGKQGTYGVQDLLQIMAEGENAVNEITPHGYTFEKDDKNPVLLQFETFDGTKKAASPEFLMAMIIRQQLKAIENETGKKPISIAFCIFNVLAEKEIKNIHIALGKACELIKIKDYCFVPSP